MSHTLVYWIAPLLFIVAMTLGWLPHRLSVKGYGFLVGFVFLFGGIEYFIGYYPAINARFELWLALFIGTLLLVRVLGDQTEKVLKKTSFLWKRTNLFLLLFLFLPFLGPSIGILLPLALVGWALYRRMNQKKGAKPHFTVVGGEGGSGGSFSARVVRSLWPTISQKALPLMQLSFYTFLAFLVASVMEPILVGAAAVTTYPQQASLVKAIKVKTLPQINVSDVPVMARRSALAAFQNVVGNLGSQYHVSQQGMALVRYKGQLVWTAPLDFNNVLIWLERGSTPGFVWMRANSANSHPHLVVNQALRITPRAPLYDNLNRILYQHFPTLIIGTSDWEISPHGHGYWVTSLYKPAPGLDAVVTRVMVGSAVTNAVTGQVRYYPFGKQPSWVSQVVGPGFAQSEAARYGWDRAGFFQATFAHAHATQPVHAVPYNVLLANGGLGWEIPMTSPSSSDQSLSGMILIDAETNKVYYTSFTGVQNDIAISNRIDGATVNSQLHPGRALLYNADGHLAYIAPIENRNGLLQEVAMVDPTNMSAPILAPDLGQAEQSWLNYLQGNGKSISGKASMGHFSGIVQRVAAVMQTQGTGSAATLRQIWLYRIGTHAYEVTLNVAPNTVPFVQKGDKVKGTYTGSQAPFKIVKLTDLSLGATTKKGAVG